jgi:predicted amino acid racemase
VLFPRLTVDLDRIRANARKMIDACRPAIAVMGVTKGLCGAVDVARVLVEAGVESLGDARLSNVERLRRADLGVPLWLLRSPGPSEVPAAVSLCDGSLQADAGVVELVAEEARRKGRRHRVLLMVDLDTGREGFRPEDALALSRDLRGHSALELAGLGVYLDFRSDDALVRRKSREFAALASSAGIELPLRSGGSSNVFHTLLLDGELPPAINHLRIGTAPLLGISSSHGPRGIEGWDRDTFLLEAEVIEVKRGRPEALLALGHLDAPSEYLYPRDPGVVVLRSSSDHTVVDFEKAPAPLGAGDRLKFHLGYYALNRLMISPFIHRVYLPGGST